MERALGAVSIHVEREEATAGQDELGAVYPARTVGTSQNRHVLGSPLDHAPHQGAARFELEDHFNAAGGVAPTRSQRLKDMLTAQLVHEDRREPCSV